MFILLLYVDDMLIVEKDTNKDQKLEEGFEQVFLNEGLGTGKANPRDAHSPGLDEEAIVDVT